MEMEFVVNEAKLYGQDILEAHLFSEYVRNCLYRQGYRTVGHLARMTVQDLRNIEGLYERQCTEIVETLAENGIKIPEERASHLPRIYDAARKLPYPQNLIYDILVNTPDEKSVQDMLGYDHIRGLDVALAMLSDQEETMLLLRYKHLYSLEAVGKHYRVTHERVRQIIHVALRKLRHPSRRCLIKLGLNGYIESRIEQEVNERVEARIATLLYDDYLRGYHHGLDDSGDDTATLRKARLLAQPIENLDLSVRSYNCLKRAGTNTIEDLLEMNAEKVLLIRNLGRKSTEEIAMKLREANIPAPAWEAAVAEYQRRRSLYEATQTHEE